MTTTLTRSISTGMLTNERETFDTSVIRRTNNNTNNHTLYIVKMDRRPKGKTKNGGGGPSCTFGCLDATSISPPPFPHKGSLAHITKRAQPLLMSRKACLRG